MSAAGVVALAAQVSACLAAALLVAFLGRSAARWLRQPEVIGEITAGLLVGTALLRTLGPRVFDLVLPAPVVGALHKVAEVGLALFLAALIYQLRRVGPGTSSRKTTTWVIAGALVPSLFTGVLLAGWVLLTDNAALRGRAPLPAFVLFVAVALSITAVPVLARILADRDSLRSRSGRLALAAAVVIDAAGWLLMSIALGLRTGTITGFLRIALLLGGGVLAALLLRRILSTGFASHTGIRLPRVWAVLFGVIAVAAALSAQRLGLTLPVGAALVGLAVPAQDSAPWAAAMSPVSRAGRVLVPVFFVVTGITVLTNAVGSAPWTLIVLATVLASVGKIWGGYLGAKWGGETRQTALRVGVLVNTRGLTELIMLQIGYSAGIVTAPLFLALVVMALVTTALTGPLLLLLDSREAHRARARRAGYATRAAAGHRA